MSQPGPLAPALPGAGGRRPEDGLDTWRPLRYFNLYRATLAGLLVVLVTTGAAPRSFGDLRPHLFLATALGYVAFAGLCALGLRLRRPAFAWQVAWQVLGDTLALSLMLLSSGGVRSGFGLLLVVAVAGGSILSPGRTATGFAAVGSLAVLVQEVLGPQGPGGREAALTQAGILGAALFATAFLAHLIARRVRESEALAHQRAADLASLARLNEHILQRMQSGILAVDAEGQVRLANESARRLLGLARLEPGTRVEQVSPDLAGLVRDWQREGAVASRTFRPAGAGVEVIASLAAIAQPGSGAALLFLEDMASVTQRAQHLKLVSLGRLTASIAHEIRNPLAAISHAAQLLQESPELGWADRRLTRIITEQSHRLNAVIGNVLQLSRRRDADLQRFVAREWLQGLLGDLNRQRGLAAGDVVVEVDPADLEVRADPSQLQQVVQNLCDNGLRYARGRPLLRLIAGVSAETERPYLLVCDSGPGVPPEAAEHLFEPFFTTEGKGTGLGLYIARELCEANQAVLEHLGCSDRGHCFRITFTHPARRGSVSP